MELGAQVENANSNANTDANTEATANSALKPPGSTATAHGGGAGGGRKVVEGTPGYEFARVG